MMRSAVPMKIMHILYVEDNQHDADLTRRYLTRYAAHIRMEHAPTYTRAIEKLAASTSEVPIYDLVLTDMRLPDGDGLRVLAHVRGRALPIPVIMLTGTGSEEMAVAALKGGAEDYITKRHDYLAYLPALLENALTRFRATVSRHSRPLRVLYAEHHAADVDLTQRHLMRTAPHIQLEVVHTAAEVLHLFATEANAQRFDLMLLDYRLPGMNALDLLKELDYRDAHKVPVVLVTGQGDEEVAVQALRLGITDYLVKNPGYLFQLPRVLENTYTQALLQRERTALVESEQRYRALFDLAPVVVFTKDMAGVYTSANTLTMEVLGRDPVGYTDAEMIGVEDANAFAAADRAVLESGEERVFEDRVSTPSGVRYFFTRKSPLRDRRGQINGLMGIGLEITASVRAEEAQGENQRRLAQLVEHVDEVIWLAETGSGKLLYVSPTYSQVWGHSLTSLYADPHSMIAAIRADDSAVAERFQQALVQGENCTCEFRIERPNGAIAWVAAHTFPIEDEAGHVYRVAGVARDITEQRRSEAYLQQQERLVAVGQMAAGIAHDFNNILAIIMLYTQMLQISVQQAAHQRHLSTIYQQAVHASELVQQILDFSRRSPMERVTVDMVPFVKELVRMWQRTLPESIRVELEVNYPSFTILADPARLQQALMNMAINARDAMPNGGILRLGLSPLSVVAGGQSPVANMGVGNWLCIGMGDSGTGIPADVLPHIFDPFYTTKAPGIGTGLGLAQVHGIIHQLDGFIRVESQVGHGTLFTIYFPLVDQPATAVGESQSPPPRGMGETILLVEDESALREAMAETLTQLGYQVLTAANGRQAIALFGEHAATINVVVSDLIMPDIGGKELYQALVQSEAHPGPLRMLLVTGYPRDENEEWHTGKGTQGTIRWLQKPFAMETFAHCVAETLHAPSLREP
jgi:PAS domain S-box-containing protein